MWLKSETYEYKYFIIILKNECAMSDPSATHNQWLNATDFVFNRCVQKRELGRVMITEPTLVYE